MAFCAFGFLCFKVRPLNQIHKKISRIWIGLTGGQMGLWPSWIINLPSISSSAAG